MVKTSTFHKSVTLQRSATQTTSLNEECMGELNNGQQQLSNTTRIEMVYTSELCVEPADLSNVVFLTTFTIDQAVLNVTKPTNVLN